jgi:hypothetical protein
MVYDTRAKVAITHQLPTIYDWRHHHLALLSSIEVGLALVVVCQATQGVHLGAVESSNERLGTLHCCCVLATLERPLVDWSPLAPSPNAALHLAALGHFKAVKGVAVRAEQAGHKVVATAELATVGIKLLPPILMVAVADGNG